VAEKASMLANERRSVVNVQMECGGVAGAVELTCIRL
jgi:hypothetical protein